MIVTIITTSIISHSVKADEPTPQAIQTQPSVAQEIQEPLVEPIVEQPVQQPKATEPVKKPVVAPKQYEEGICVKAMQQYFPPEQWETATFVMKMESGLNPNAVSSTSDYGCAQINREPAALDPYISAQRMYQKYVGGRVGANNWSAWYAVCTPGNAPTPKYAGIHCI